MEGTLGKKNADTADNVEAIMTLGSVEFVRSRQIFGLRLPEGDFMV